MGSRISRDIYWELWECLPVESVIALANYQWEHYGTKLDILFWVGKDMYQPDIEPVEEIDKLMRQKPKTKARG